jgi:hypothetical protein
MGREIGDTLLEGEKIPPEFSQPIFRLKKLL